MKRNQTSLRSALFLLIVAAMFVSFAIAVGGSVGRTLSGLGAVLWMLATIPLALGLRRDPRWWLVLAATAAGLVIIIEVIRPTTPVMALVGFAFSASMAAAVAREPLRGALFLAAAYLPVHLTIAIGGSLLRAIQSGETAVRSDPPPTPALVPLMMVVGAILAGLAVIYVRDLYVARHENIARKSKRG